MNNQLPKLLSEISTSIRLIPPGYRWPLVAVGLLVVGLIVSIILVTPEAPPVPLPPVRMSPPVAVAPDTGNPVKDLFDPNQQQNAEQQKQSAALAQVDNILLTSYMLVHCNKMKAEEYNDTYQLLISYAKMQNLALTIEDADKLVRERAKAAAGSYELIYSRLACGDLDRTKLSDDLDKWRRNMRLAGVRPRP